MFKSFARVCGCRREIVREVTCVYLKHITYLARGKCFGLSEDVCGGRRIAAGISGNRNENRTAEVRKSIHEMGVIAVLAYLRS